jgi:hypothetical protein
MPKPMVRLKMQAKTKVGLLNGVSLDDRPAGVERALEEQAKATSDAQAAMAMWRSWNQSFAWAFFQHVLQPAEEDGHGGEVGVVDGLQHA